MRNDLLTYLNNRGIVIGDRGENLEISKDNDLLSSVAGAWTSNKEAITAVIQARCDILREKLIFSDQPFETPVTRQALVELGGILEDFEKLQAEFDNREKGKPKKAEPEETVEPPKEA